MDFRSPFVKPKSPLNVPFDVRSFQNLLEDLKQSKREQEVKAKPLFDLEQ
jgi:hypothetical protein